MSDLSPKVKYTFLFSTWIFLSAFSFYLGMNLLGAGKQSSSLLSPNGYNLKPDPKFLPPGEKKETNKTETQSQENNSLPEKTLGSEETQALESPSVAETKIAPVLGEEKVSFRSSAWSTDWSAMQKTVHLYNEIHPFIYTMKGGLSNNGELVSSWSSTARKERVEELRRLNPKVKIIPTIFRWENPKEKIQENIGMNGRSDIRNYHIQVILKEIETYGYDGIDIDYEGMTCDKKEKFEEFFKLLAIEVHKKGKLLSVAVHPKTPAEKQIEFICKGLNKPITMDFRENWRGPTTHDYEFLAKHADRVKIMAYELHPRKYHNPGPGPQAPNVWLKDIITYAKQKVPTEKLFMAIPTYGYDWALNCKSGAKAVYHSDAQKIKAGIHKRYQPTDINEILNRENKMANWKNLSKFADIHKNRAYEDPTLWYSNGSCDRVAFYMNRKAFEDKMTLLRKYELGGFSFWQLVTDNDPEINDYLALLVQGKLPPVKKVVEEEEVVQTKPAEVKLNHPTKQNP